LATGLNPRTVLIVDDQPDVLRPQAQSLERAGYRVVFAESANKALDAVREQVPDAILIDLKMPYVNGMGLVYRLRELKPRIPMAMITGAMDVAEETRNELLTMGVDLHFKPLTLERTRAIVDGLIGTSNPN
jgi:DNA-binding NtrC family response regulator